ncbi:MAG: TaqI-like C-terminal specificity domain-containing protein [Segetibacter sp.]
MLKADRCSSHCYLCSCKYFYTNTVYNVYLKEEKIADLKFILAIINSKATTYVWKKSNSDEKKTFPKIKKEAILSIPIPEVKGDIQKKLSDEIIRSVDLMLRLKLEKQVTPQSDKINHLNQRIAYTDERINKLVYELYGLSEEEIGIVEGR